MTKKIAIVVNGSRQDPFTQHYRSGTSPFVDDDLHLVDALTSLGAEVCGVPWDCETRDWSTFNLVLIRSTWGFFFELEKFHQWLGRMEADKIRLHNRPEIVRSNISKKYLTILDKNGIGIFPSEIVERNTRQPFDLKEVLMRRGWDEFVIKPASLGGSYNSHRASLDTIEEMQTIAVDIMGDDDLVVQQFMPDISSGEVSLVFFAGSFSHAVRKIPAPGDWREQAHLGGRVVEYAPPPAVISQAQNARDVLAPESLIARIDGIVRDTTLLINEVELIDPRLFFKESPSAARTLAECVLDEAKK